MSDHQHAPLDQAIQRLSSARRMGPHRMQYPSFHEAAHAEGVVARTHGRARAECIVEGATYIVCARVGLDVRASSVPYIAGWDSAEPGALERDAAEINRIALAVQRRLADAGRADDD